jgi:ATP-binding cassette, subfamily B, bacterial CvaB/MchF/RaxB
MAPMNWLDSLNLNWATRLPMVLQVEAAECGLACMAMIASYYGHHADISDFRRRFGLSLRGATLKDLMHMADELGFTTRPLRLELGELSQLQTPCILHWDMNHFVVLKSVQAKTITLHDPAAGIRKLALSEISKHFTGVALEFTPTQKFEPAEPPTKLKMKTLVGRMVGLKRALGQVFLLALAIEICAVVGPFFMQWVIDHALVTADPDLLITLVLGFTLLLFIRVSLSALRAWLLMALGASLKVQGRTNLFAHLVNLPASYFEGRYIGDVMSRFGSQETILQTITTNMVEVILDGLLAIITLAVMVAYAPSLTIVVLAGAGLYGLLRWVSFQPLRQASTEAIVLSARRDSHFLETLRGIKTIKLFNAQTSRRVNWLNLLVQTINRQLTTQKLGLLFSHASMLITGLLAIVVIWLGANQVMANHFSVGMLLAFISYKDQFLSLTNNLVDRALDLYMLRLHAERLADIALTEPEAVVKGSGRMGDRQRVAVEVRNLGFRYGDNEPWVLDDVNFRIEPGETVAIIGTSGCGKTTLLKLLASLLTPTKGEIIINGRRLDSIGMETYRSILGVVMQDDQLFAGSLADNISFFADNQDLARVEQCARLAAIHEDIAKMPMGYSTLIGDMGTVLSGGQKQRVLIARALYRNPGILLLDEATSHLDVEREKAVNTAIRATEVTRIIVAHRPETIQSTDRYIVLDKGKVVKDLQRKQKANSIP